MSFERIHKGLFVAAILFTSALGFAQLTVNYSGPVASIDAPGDSDNQIGYATWVYPTAPLGSSMRFNSGTLTKVNALTYASEARLRIRTNRYPDDYADVQPFTTNSYTGSINLTPGEWRPLVGTLVGKNLQYGDLISIEFFESYDDDFNLPESNWTNLSLTISRPEPPGYEDLGTLGLTTLAKSATIATSSVKWYKFVLADAVSGTRFLDIDNNGTTASATQDTSMGLYDVSGNLVTTDTADGFAEAAAIFKGSAQPWGGRNATAAFSEIRNGQDGTLAAGTYFLAVCNGNQTFGATNFGVVSTSPISGTVNTTFYHQNDTGPVWPPPGALDQGIVSSSFVTGSVCAPASGRWFKFTIPAVASPLWLDIDTEDTVNFLSVPNSGFGTANDTEIGLYNAAGTLIASDDDDGSGLRSQLTFGDTTDRGTQVTNGDAPSAPRNGRDGNLPAGTYYLYVSGYETRFAGADYGAYSGGVVTKSHSQGLIYVVFRSNLPNTISGTVDLQDYSMDPAGLVMQWELIDSGQVQRFGAVILGPGGTYTIAHDANITQGVLTMKGAHWLKAGTTQLDITNHMSNINFTLKNGDVDGDNEVGPGDFGALSSAFGSVPGDSNWNPNADLDGDLEVGPSDFGILSANFGESGY